MFERFRNKNTAFGAGYLIPEEIPVRGPQVYAVSEQFQSPRRLDFRDMCLQTSNQKSTPHCAGYSTAGYIEVHNWIKDHYPKQLDGDAIYKKAKKFDEYKGDGTTLTMAVKGAIALGLIKGKGKYVSPRRRDVKFAIHEHRVCIAGFMITNEWNSVNRKTGLINNFKTKAKQIGGHAVLLCGYCREGIYIQNSWGTGWGLHGFGLLSWSQFDQQFMNGMVIVKK